ncbi:energy transducer TonB [Hyphomicrobium sp.]|uniref:energy transducer TonB n=1 Tax=Hyphomicrobium sp. TaxID=82 RepID=UPI0025C5E0FE|nr:energy transducer TonB [Hyphomicrobium sp.]MCC7251873.1 energy transducer TonB [Hyphomicrobium sp.]
MITTFELLEPSWRRWRRWAGAGLLVLTLHVGGATAALWQWPEEEVDDEPEGAMLIELAPMPIAPAEERQDLAPGPQSEDSVPVPPTEEVKELKPEELLPPVEEAPLVPEPEVALEKVKPIEEEEEEEEKKPQEEVQAQTVASLAAAPPPIEAAEKGPQAAAPHQGASRKPNQAILSWQKALHLHLSKHKRYPGEARARRIQGVVTVGFAIDREGRVTNARIVKGSGSSLLDDEALEMLSRASPLPVPPDEATVTARSLSLPIQFNIR